jgi:hypothetical protein
MTKRGSWSGPLKSLPWYFGVSVFFGIVFLGLALISALRGHVDWAGFQVSLSVLVIAGASLLATLPTPAKLWIERQHELGIDDVIFYIYDEPEMGRIPRDILFQVHVAVANVGGRKAILSALRIEALLDADGRKIEIPAFILPVLAQRVRQGGGWRIVDDVMHKHSYMDFMPGPYLLEPDDVITMRLRARPGIDWSDKWTVEMLRAMAVSLDRPLRGVAVSADYRQGNRLVTDRFEISGLSVLQQDEYVEELRLLTNEFKLRPNIAARQITD